MPISVKCTISLSKPSQTQRTKNFCNRSSSYLYVRFSTTYATAACCCLPNMDQGLDGIDNHDVAVCDGGSALLFLVCRDILAFTTPPFQAVSDRAVSVCCQQLLYLAHERRAIEAEREGEGAKKGERKYALSFLFSVVLWQTTTTHYNTFTGRGNSFVESC